MNNHECATLDAWLTEEDCGDPETTRGLREFTIEATVTRVYRQTVTVSIPIKAITAMAAHDTVIDEIVNGSQYDDEITTALANEPIAADTSYEIECSCPCDCSPELKRMNAHSSDCIEYRR